VEFCSSCVIVFIGMTLIPAPSNNFCINIKLITIYIYIFSEMTACTLLHSAGNLHYDIFIILLCLTIGVHYLVII
jgi:hypothetical protein